ncbi:MAG: KTSC domain-containing protein [Planctomycetota bacterium]
MEWVPSPESSNIVRFGYEAANQELFVEFKRGGVYQYFDVPQTIFDQMKAAPSKGSFLAQMVKGRYRYARM